MRFNIEPPVARAAAGAFTVKVGDVYPAKGGARRKIAMWIVLSMSPSNRMVHMVGLNEEGEITYELQDGII